DAGGRNIYDAGLGPDRPGSWAAASPVSADLHGLRTRILLGTAAGDRLVPPAQMVLLASALGRAGAPAPLLLTPPAGAPPPRFGSACAPGSTPFGHACVTSAAYRDYLAAESLFMAGV